jgi:hypothetical protein
MSSKRSRSSDTDDNPAPNSKRVKNDVSSSPSTDVGYALKEIIDDVDWQNIERLWPTILRLSFACARVDMPGVLLVNIIAPYAMPMLVNPTTVGPIIDEVLEDAVCSCPDERYAMSTVPCILHDDESCCVLCGNNIEMHNDNCPIQDIEDVYQPPSLYHLMKAFPDRWSTSFDPDLPTTDDEDTPANE